MSIPIAFSGTQNQSIRVSPGCYEVVFLKRRKRPTPNSAFKRILNAGKIDDLESRWLLQTPKVSQRILGLDERIPIENCLDSLPVAEQLTRKGRRRSQLYVLVGKTMIETLGELGQGLFLTSSRLPNHQATLRTEDGLRGDAERGDRFAAAMSDHDEDVTRRMENRLLLRTLRGIKAVGRIGLLPLKQSTPEREDKDRFRLVYLRRALGLDFPKA